MRKLFFATSAVLALSVVCSVEAYAEPAAGPVALSPAELEATTGGFLDNSINNTITDVSGSVLTVRGNTANTSASGGLPAEGGIFVDAPNDQTFTQTATVDIGGLTGTELIDFVGAVGGLSD